MCGLRTTAWGSQRCWALPLSQNNPTQHCRLEEELESCWAEKDLVFVVDSQLIWASSVPKWPRKPTASWLVSAIVWPAGLISDHSPVLGTGEAGSGVLCSVLEPSLQKGHWAAGARPEKGNWADEQSETQTLWGTAEGRGDIWPQIRRLKEHFISLYDYLKGGCDEVGVAHFSQVPSDKIKENIIELFQMWFRLDIRKKILTEGAVKHWNRLPREVVTVS